MLRDLWRRGREEKGTKVCGREGGMLEAGKLGFLLFSSVSRCRVLVVVLPPDAWCIVLGLIYSTGSFWSGVCVVVEPGIDPQAPHSWVLLRGTPAYWD